MSDMMILNRQFLFLFFPTNFVAFWTGKREIFGIFFWTGKRVNFTNSANFVEKLTKLQMSQN
jgi:hypothetical protein